MSRTLALTALLTVAACSDVTEPTPTLDLNFVIVAPGYSDQYHYEGATATVRRVTYLDAWYPVAPAKLTRTLVYKVPGGWSGAGSVPEVIQLSLAETDALFSQHGLVLPASYAYRVDVRVVNRVTGERVDGYDYFRVILP